MKRDLTERLMDFENEGITASDRYHLRCEAATTVHELREALQSVVTDILDYERVNNLAPSPGRKYCWDSVARAVAVISKTKDVEERLS